jgi:predicted aspartyl protease
MGRVVASVTIANVASSERLRCDALVDTGASYMTLPLAWRERLGELETVRTVVELETATQEVRKGEVCGPVRIEIEGFAPVFSEVLFVEMTPEEGQYEPLLGYIVLEQSQATVDPLGQRLIHVKRMDLKRGCEGRKIGR